MAEQTVAQPEKSAQLCAHLQQFIDTYVNLPVIVAAADHSPVFAACCVCSPNAQAVTMLDSGEKAVACL